MHIKAVIFPALLTMCFSGCNDLPSDTSDETPKTDETLVSETQTPTEEFVSKLPADAPTYSVYIDNKYPPFAFKDNFGNPIGFDIDILTAVGEEAGFRTTFTGDNWEGIFENLDNGKADIVASGVSITDERKKVMEFTTPYLDTSVVIAYNSSEEKKYSALKSGKFGVQQGSSYIDQLTNEEGINRKQIVEYNTTFLAMQNLLSSNVDAIVDDKAIINYLTQSLADKTDISNLKIIALPGSENHPMAFAITKGNTDLVTQVDNGIETIRFNGKYEEIYNKWFGTTATAE